MTVRISPDNLMLLLRSPLAWHCTGQVRHRYFHSVASLYNTTLGPILFLCFVALFITRYLRNTMRDARRQWPENDR